jgi:hypothetical protein
MKVDLFSIIQKGKRTISFMSQALGLMAELDLGTENLRWMGDTRFAVGFLRGGAEESIAKCHLPELVIPFSGSIQTMPGHIVYQGSRAR